MQGVVTGKACPASRVGSLYQQRSHARGKSLSRPFIRKFVVAFKEAEVYQPSEQSLKDTIFEVPSIGARQVVLKSEVIKESGLKPALVHRNLAPAELYEHALKYEEGTHIVSSGALATLSGEKTGRSPKDKRVVRDFESDQDIWWAGAGDASPNMEMDERTFLMNRETAISYLNTLDRIYVLDGFANWDNENRVKIRVITSRPYHALFMHNMLIRPSKVELATFGEPDFTIFNGGEFPANKYASYMTSSTSINVSLKHKQMVILGSQYAGEMKKGVFSVMQYLMPLRNILTLHSGANMGKDGDVTLFFGLSGTGKTTLSADPARPLIGDDEHCWSDAGIANIEGGCYAKTIALREEKEPDIYRALRFGALLENVVYDSSDRVVDYDSSEVTENTRASYPIEFIDNARVPCTGPHPKNIILLCCDAFGVLPPVSRLTAEQAQYHFISGYTAKVAGTEMGIKEPQATFSPCFGGAFLMLHPMRYASMLAERMAQHGTTAWLVNTGWVGGAYGVGQRIPLKYTRAIIDAIHSGSLEEGVCSYSSTPIFNLKVPDVCPGVPQTLLHPEQSWPDKAEFRETLEHLAELFHENFRKYEGSSYVSEATSHAIASGGPKPHAWWLGGDGMHRRNGSNPERS